MADFLGTTGDDELDQVKLKLADWSGTIRGLAGNDKITGGNIHMQGGAGNDKITGTTSSSTVNYFDSPKGISANLKTGLVDDGWGSTDTLVNIHVIHGSNYADQFVGSDLVDNFWVNVGDFVDGGAGVDTATIWEDQSKWKIEKLDATRSLVTQVITGKEIELNNVEKVQFKDATVNLEFDQLLVYKDTAPSLNAGVAAYSSDLNHDGLFDIVVASSSFPPAPNIENLPQVLIQNKDGTFKKAAFNGSLEGFVHPREIASGDFNGDGFKDVVIIGHGYDTSPFEGETPTVLFGQANGSFLDASELLPQTPAFTHSVAVADVNKDGLDDIFLGNIWGKQEFVPQLLIAKKTGGFKKAALPNSVATDALKTNGTLPVASLLSDLNGDGFHELIAGGGDNGVFIYKGQNQNPTTASSFFDASRQALPAGVFGSNTTTTLDIQALDVNNDGLKDLILSQAGIAYAGRAIQVLIQTPSGAWRDETNQRIHGLNKDDTWIAFLNFIDLNQDGHQDILASATSANQTAAWVNDGTGNFFPAGSSNGVPNLSGGTLLPAENGKIFAVENIANGLLSVSQIKLLKGHTGPNLTLPADQGAPGFNEQYYLNSNPDVVQKISQGTYATGLAHYLSVGIAQGARGFAEGTNVWGSSDIDTVTYGGNLGNYLLRKTDGSNWQVSKLSTGIRPDSLVDIERVKFKDVAIASDFDGAAGLVTKILGAVFGKESLANKNYVGIGLKLADSGWTYDNLAGLALDTAGAKTSDQIVSLLWRNVIGTQPTQSEKAPFIALLENGMSAGALAHLAADSTFNTTNINLIGLAQTGIEYIPAD
jgi:hypothetical protein